MAFVKEASLGLMFELAKCYWFVIRRCGTYLEIFFFSLSRESLFKGAKVFFRSLYS